MSTQLCSCNCGAVIVQNRISSGGYSGKKYFSQACKNRARQRRKQRTGKRVVVENPSLPNLDNFLYRWHA